jgi:hypothetical protein
MYEMRKSTKQIAIGLHEVRHIVTLIGDRISMGEQEKVMSQYEMLRQLVAQPELMICGPQRFEDLHMYWSGSEWVIEMKVTVEKTDAQT